MTGLEGALIIAIARLWVRVMLVLTDKALPTIPYKIDAEFPR